jgi:hypothetical protein
MGIVDEFVDEFGWGWYSCGTVKSIPLKESG